MFSHCSHKSQLAGMIHFYMVIIWSNYLQSTMLDPKSNRIVALLDDTFVSEARSVCRSVEENLHQRALVR